MSEAAEKLAAVRAVITQAARSSGRTADAVRLVAVSKTQSVDAVRALLDAGQTDFGESQVQDAMRKIPLLNGLGLHWHFIGHLQSNKTRFIPGNFEWVHTLEKEKHAARIAQAAQQAGVCVKLLLQVNVANDPAKQGLHSNEVFAFIERILEQQLAGIQLRGLMSIGRRGAGEPETRATFAGLRELLESCRQRFGGEFDQLSMGMSNDYAIAIEEGATMVRVGTDLFGARK